MKKTMKKLLPLLLAVVMSLAFAGAALAAGTGTITITPPTGVDPDATNTYKIYKVFDADGDGTNISYKLVSGKAAPPAGFTVDSAGNVTYTGSSQSGELNADDIAAIAAYVTESDLVGTATSTGTADATASDLPNGYYYITTSTGTVVTIDSTNPNAKVRDKNEVPPLSKKITAADSIVDEAGTQAIAQVGKSVEYTVTITKKHGAENYVMRDNLGAGLQYNKDAKVYVNGTEVGASAGTFTKTTEDDDSLVITFANDWIAGLNDETVITIKYTALVTDDALQTNPAKNTAWLEYGHTPGTYSTPTQQTETYNAKFSVTKQDEKKEALKGAGFVLMNADEKYYKYTAATESAPEKIEWVDTIESATEYVSGEDGKLNGEFTGLCNGTYTLVEKTVPSGYNKAQDYSFTVEDKDVSSSNLIQSTTVVNKAGAELPETGGIGTTIFYIAGSALVLVAGAALFARRVARKQS